MLHEQAVVPYVFATLDLKRTTPPHANPHYRPTSSSSTPTSPTAFPPALAAQRLELQQLFGTVGKDLEASGGKGMAGGADVGAAVEEIRSDASRPVLMAECERRVQRYENDLLAAAATHWRQQSDGEQTSSADPAATDAPPPYAAIAVSTASAHAPSPSEEAFYFFWTPALGDRTRAGGPVASDASTAIYCGPHRKIAEGSSLPESSVAATPAAFPLSVVREGRAVCHARYDIACMRFNYAVLLINAAAYVGHALSSGSSALSSYFGPVNAHYASSSAAGLEKEAYGYLCVAAHQLSLAQSLMHSVGTALAASTSSLAHKASDATSAKTTATTAATTAPAAEAAVSFEMHPRVLALLQAVVIAQAQEIAFGRAAKSPEGSGTHVPHLAARIAAGCERLYTQLAQQTERLTTVSGEGSGSGGVRDGLDRLRLAALAKAAVYGQVAASVHGAYFLLPLTMQQGIALRTTAGGAAEVAKAGSLPEAGAVAVRTAAETVPALKQQAVRDRCPDRCRAWAYCTLERFVEAVQRRVAELRGLGLAAAPKANGTAVIEPLPTLEALVVAKPRELPLVAPASPS